jgi:3D (Asp-Asp-Asp) domain-containing protein
MRIVLLLLLFWTNLAIAPGRPAKTLQDYVIENKPNFKIKTETITLTGYSSRVQETDSSPFETASLDTVQIGCVALSPDLIKKYGFHTLVTIEGFSMPFVVLDVMNPRHSNRADIWFPFTSWAYALGQRHNLQLNIFIPNHPGINELHLCNRRIATRGFKI